MNHKLSRVLRSQGGALWIQSAMRINSRPYESSRVNDQSRHEDHAAPTDDDMISKHYLYYTIPRGPLLEASPSLRIQRSWGVPCRQLPSLAPSACWLLEHWDLPSSDLTLGDGLKVGPLLLFDLPLFLDVLLRQPVQGASEAKESEKYHCWCLLSRLELKSLPYLAGHKVTIWWYKHI